MKSKEPKQLKENKSEAKPRKAGEKAKRVRAQAVTELQAAPVEASPVAVSPVEASPAAVSPVQASPAWVSPAKSSPKVFASEEATNGSTNGSAHFSHAAAEAYPGTIEMVAVEVDRPRVAPSEELIRLRAYELFVIGGCRHGHHLEDWLAAERELKHKHRAA